MNRRAVIHLSLILLLLLSGCFDQSFEQPTGVLVSNQDTVPHTVTVNVSVGGNTKISKTARVSGRGRESINQTLPGPGLISGQQYKVIVRTEKGNTQTKSTTAEATEGFDKILVDVESDGSIYISFADFG